MIYEMENQIDIEATNEVYTITDREEEDRNNQFDHASRLYSGFIPRTPCWRYTGGKQAYGNNKNLLHQSEWAEMGPGGR